MAFLSSKDVRRGVRLGHGDGDTEVFASEEVRSPQRSSSMLVQISYEGQPLGLIVARDHETAVRAAATVFVETEKRTPIVTIEVCLSAIPRYCQ